MNTIANSINLFNCLIKNTLLSHFLQKSLFFFIFSYHMHNFLFGIQVPPLEKVIKESRTRLFKITYNFYMA